MADVSFKRSSTPCRGPDRIMYTHTILYNNNIYFHSPDSTTSCTWMNDGSYSTYVLVDGVYEHINFGNKKNPYFK